MAGTALGRAAQPSAHPSDTLKAEGWSLTGDLNVQPLAAEMERGGGDGWVTAWQQPLLGQQ